MLPVVSKVASLGKTAMRLTKAHSPEILMCTGVISFVGTVVLASKATIKAQDILEDHADMKRDIDIVSATRSEEEYPADVRKKDVITVYSKTSIAMAKNYMPSIALGLLSLASFLGAYGILKKRNIALIAAYNGLSEAFNLYRQRVIDDKGQDADTYYLTGVKPKEITITNEDGTKEKRKVLNGNVNLANPYAFKFGKYKENGERNYQWQTDANTNKMYLLGMQDYLNDQLYARCEFNRDHCVIKRGYVFLNEMRDVCGEDMTTTGGFTGWRYSNGEPGCNGYIDFRIEEGYEDDPETGKQINCFYLNPNVDGQILTNIDSKEQVPFLPKYEKVALTD